MIIEISGVGFHNMGAELMLVAAREELRSWSSVQAVGLGIRVGSRAERAGVDCIGILRLDSLRHRRVERAFDTIAQVAPAAALRPFGTCTPRTVDALLDASGFAFGDQWGVTQCRRSARVFSGYANQGKPVVLLPQAFGPFARPGMAETAAAALELADLIFARDEESLEHVRQLSLRKPVISLAPDFTNLLEPEPERVAAGSMVVIPNARMVDMTESAIGSAYPTFLQSCIRAARDRHVQVTILVHEAADRALAANLVPMSDDGIRTIPVVNPRLAKAIVGGAAMVVSSRYHGLVNALSQTVPAAGTAWSHKYSHLFTEYACPDALWDVTDPTGAYERTSEWLEPRSLRRRREALAGPAAALKLATRAMWEQVRAAVGQ